MAIVIEGVKIGMLVQTLNDEQNVLKVDAFNDTYSKKLLHRYPNGTNVGKVILVDTVNNMVKIQLRVPLKEKLVIVRRSAFIDPKHLLVVPISVALPVKIAEMKSMYVLPKKKNILVRRSPITGSAFAKVQGNQMVRVTGQVKQGFTEVVTDNGNGWIFSNFLTITKPATVVTPKPPVQQEPGVIYVPTEKPADNSKNILTVVLSLLAGLGIYKLFKKSPKLL